MSVYATVVLAALFAAAALTPVAQELARRLGAVAHVRPRDVHLSPVPRLGGAAALGAVAFGALVADQIPRLAPATRLPLAAILVVGVVAAALGALDDVFELSGRWKLLGQVAAALVLVAFGIRVEFLPVPWSSPLELSWWAGSALTVLLVLGTVNAVNLLDGIDGLALGVVGVASAALFAYSFQLTVFQGFGFASVATLLAALLVGACLGLLPWNWSPAKVFLGDAGTTFLGVMLVAVLASLTQSVDPLQLSAADAVTPLAFYVLVLSVPFVDLCQVMVRRHRSGRPVFVASRDHLHHRLLDVGLSHAQATLLVSGWSAFLGFGAVTVSLLGEPLPAVGVVAALGALLAAAVLAPVVGVGWFVWSQRRRVERSRARAARALLREQRRSGSLPGSPVRDGVEPELPAPRSRQG